MTSRTGRYRRALARPVLLLAAGLALTGCGSGLLGSGSSPASSGLSPTPPAPAEPTSATPSKPAASASAPAASAAVSAASAAAPSPSATGVGQVDRALSRREALDRLAGVRTDKVAWSGTGKLRVVPGRSAAPGRGRVYQIRVEVEAGLNIDQQAFATYVLATLNDKRSWTENGTRRFARSDGDYDVRVVLASPQTSAAICLPLKTFGKLSCRSGDAAVLTMYRWTKAIPEYAKDRDGYRHYVINHEVGHALGHGHEYCAGRGRIAPVMMQQTKGLKGCRPNPWPHPKA
jgi:hypothetical protein